MRRPPFVVVTEAVVHLPSLHHRSLNGTKERLTALMLGNFLRKCRLMVFLPKVRVQHMIRRFLSLLLLSMLAVACATMPVTTDPRLSTTTLDAYRLDSGDKLRITVFGQADLTAEYNIDSSGRVAVPLIDPVSARGQTTDQFAHSLETALGEKLLRNPSVSVEVTQYRPFFILGEVNQPGQYAYVNGMTVMTAAAIAGGFTYRASTAGVTITRRMDDAMFEGTATIDAPIMPGD